MVEHGAKASHAHVAEEKPQPGTQWSEPPPGAWEPPPDSWSPPDEAPPQDGVLYATEEDIASMNDAQLLAFMRAGGRTKGKGKGKGGKGKGKGGKMMSRAYAGRPGMPPADRKDIRCINCGGTGHGWRACPNPELPAEKRPCLSCGKPGHFSRDCTSRPAAHLASTVEGGERPSHVTDVNGRVWALTCKTETPGDSSEQPRVRGRPYTKTVDADGFEIVTGGFRPRPRGVSVVTASGQPRDRDSERTLRMPLQPSSSRTMSPFLLQPRLSPRMVCRPLLTMADWQPT